MESIWTRPWGVAEPRALNEELMDQAFERAMEVEMSDERYERLERLVEGLESAPEIHLYPTADERAHQLSGVGCWCEPDLLCPGEAEGLHVDWAVTGLVVCHHASVSCGEVPGGWPP